MPSVSLKYAGESVLSGLADQDWLALEQEDVPHSQHICTVDDLQAMMRLAAVGQAAKAYVSDNCPVERVVRGDRVFIIYNAVILVRRSESLAGGYDLIPSEGQLSLGQTVQRKKSGQYELDYQADIFLGWLPVHPPTVRWITKVKNSDKMRVFLPGLPEGYNGFLYFPEAYRGFANISGMEVYDRYVLPIEHEQGYRFDKTVLVTAEWGAEDENGNRESVQLDVRPPQCWIDEANKCPGGNFFSSFGMPGNNEKGSGGWNVNYGPATKKAWFGPCSGKILRVETLF